MKQVATTTAVPRKRVDQIMRDVLLALLPGIAVCIVLYGFAPLRNLAIACLACLLIEAAVLHLRSRRLPRLGGDGSALLTGALLALCLPATAPWWLLLAGAVAAMLPGKHLYGGLGQNPFNPAMVGVAVLIVSFPAQMSLWPAPLAVWSSGTDAISSATPLDHLRTQLALNRTLGEIAGDSAASLTALSALALAWLTGGLYLLWRGAIRWQIPAGVLLGIAIPATLFWIADGERYASPLFHLLGGAAIFGAFFIATDPITAAATPRGRLLYGFGIGTLAWAIRTWGSYPDGFAFAVLMLNLCVPLIDRHLSIRAHTRK